MKLTPAAPTTAQSIFEKCLASKFAIRLHLLIAFHVERHRRARGNYQYDWHRPERADVLGPS
jgi:hypothetical protein